MQRVTPWGCSVRTFLALVAITATFLTTASIGSSTHSAPFKAYVCPPAC